MALDGSGRLISHPGHFTARKTALDPLNRRLGGCLEEKNLLLSARNRATDCPDHSLVTIPPKAIDIRDLFHLALLWKDEI